MNTLTTDLNGQTSAAPYIKFAKRYYSEITAPTKMATSLFDALFTEFGDDTNRQEALATAFHQYGITRNTASYWFNCSRKRAGC